MHNFVLFCKTYRGDYVRFKMLKRSIDQYNVEKIPLYVVCPKADLDMFVALRGRDVDYEYVVLTDEEVLGMEEEHEQNWYSQQAIKMAFHRMKICNFYLSLDSDSYFISPFGISDFMYDDGTPYLVMHENKDFRVFCNTVDEGNVFASARKIKEFFGRTGRDYQFLTTPCVFSSEVFARLESEVDSFENLIDIAPLEAFWHGEYLLKLGTMNFKPCEPFFKCFNYDVEYDAIRRTGADVEDFNNAGYLGMVMQKGWVGDMVYRPAFFAKSWRKLMVLKFYIGRNMSHKLKDRGFIRRVSFYVRYYTINLIGYVFLGRRK